METLQLIQMARNGDQKARDEVVKKNQGLVWSIVKRFRGRSYEAEDLFQIGIIGLLKAVDKFDSSFEVKFSTYAVPMIMGEIKRFLRDDGMIKVSRTWKEMAGKIKKERNAFFSSFGREATVEELSKRLQLNQEDIIMALEANTEVESLDQTVYQGDGNPIYLIDQIEQEKDESESVVDIIALKEVLALLETKERKIIHLRYFQGKTQVEIAKSLGISQVQVSRLEKKILQRMREKLV